MPWYRKNAINFTENTTKIIYELVFMCPCEILHKTKNPEHAINERTPSYITTYEQVSQQEKTFRRRGIVSSLLTTILAQIRKPIAQNKAFEMLLSDGSVEHTVAEIIRTSDLSDPYFDLIVFKKRSDMSDTSALYYYIRNAFAHGAFSIENYQGEIIYMLESKKDTDIKAQMRLKESTLLDIAALVNMSPNDIRALQRRRPDKSKSTKKHKVLEPAL